MTGEGYVDCLFELRNFGRQKRYVTGKPGEEIVFRSVAEIRDFAEDLKEEEEELALKKQRIKTT
jgi:hypothetical protein